MTGAVQSENGSVRRKHLLLLDLLEQGSVNSFLKGQIITSLGFAGHVASVELLNSATVV